MFFGEGYAISARERIGTGRGFTLKSENALFLKREKRLIVGGVKDFQCVFLKKALALSGLCYTDVVFLSFR